MKRIPTTHPRTGSRPAPALVLDVGWVNGLAAVRSLGRAGIPVYAVDHRRSALGFRSRYAEPRLSPDPVDEEDAYVDFLARLGERLPAPTPVFPTHDPPLNAVARGRERLGERFLYPFPAWDVLERIQSKRAQLETAEASGIPIPRTFAAPTDELGFPALVKPSNPIGFRRAFGRQAFRCETRAELDDAFERARPYEPLVQEVIPGGDEELYSLGSYLRPDGEALGLFTGRKLEQYPRGVGTCRVGEALWVEEVVDQGLALLRALGFHGISQVEFKRDPRDGAYKLMEVNPRLWQWHGLAAACGVDLPLIAYRDLTGDRPEPARMNGRPRRWAITLLRGSAPVLVKPPYVDAVFSRDDPKPAVVQAARALRPGR